MTDKIIDDLSFKLLMSTLLDYKQRIEKLEKEMSDLNGAICSNTRSIQHLTGITDIHRTEINILLNRIWS